MFHRVIFVVGGVFSVITCARIFPSGVKLCRRSLPNFNHCVAEEFTKSLKIFAPGYKPLSVPQLEPLFVKELHLEGSGSNTLDQHYYNVYISGLTNTTVDKFELQESEEDVIMKLTATTHNTNMNADYELKGRVIIFPLDSKGKCNISMRNSVVDHQFVSKKVTRKGKTFMKLINYKYNLRSIDEVVFDFSNIIPGNEQLSKEVLKTINENSQSVFNEIKPGFEKSQTILLGKITSNVFNKVGLNEFFLD